MPSLSRSQFGDKIDRHETRGLIFVPETLAAAEARLASRSFNTRSRTPRAEVNMNNRRKTLVKICIVVFLFTILLISQYGSYFGRPQLNKLLYADNQTVAFLNRIPSLGELQLDLPHCKIPNIDPKSKHYIADEIHFESCEEEDAFSTIENGQLEIHGVSPENCCVSEIVRPFELASDSFENGPCLPINSSSSTKIGKKEFISVACKKSEKTVFNFHARVVPSANYLKSKIAHWQNEDELPVNVLVLVLDSTSRTDAFRHLPKTIALLNELNFVDFRGFHHLGEPTMLNAIPLLVGVPTAEFFDKTKLSWKEPWDKVPFVWREFNNSQYATGFIEDYPDAGTFNYGQQTGFTFKPTDFYLRPFFTANVVNTGSRRDIMAAKKACIGKTPMGKYLLDYQFEMLNKMNGLVPIFSMPWSCWPQHDFPGVLHRMEEITLGFFQSLKNSPSILENTLIIFMADHGFYGGPYAQTHEGLMERRLPLFMMRLPKKLTSKYPEFADRVIENSKRVTSHYDVYKTLLHIAQLSSPKGAGLMLDNNIIPTVDIERKFGTSLLNWIPERRTCVEAGIPETNCACNLPFPPENLDASVPVPEIMEFSNKKTFFVARRRRKANSG